MDDGSKWYETFRIVECFVVRVVNFSVFELQLFVKSMDPKFSSTFQVEFSADTLRLNLIDLARTGSKLITVTGRLEYACTATDSADPVTFATKDAHLVSSHQPY